MRYCDQHPEEIDKLAKVKAQVTEVKGVMMQNIEKVCLFLAHRLLIKGSTFLLLEFLYTVHQVLDRGEKIELLVDKTEDLRSQVHYILNLAWNSFIRDQTITKLTSFACRHKTSGNRERRYGGRCGGRI